MSWNKRIITILTLLLVLALPALAMAQPTPAAQPGATPAMTQPGTTTSTVTDDMTWWERVQDFVGPDALLIAKQVLLGILLFLAGWILAKFLSWTVYRLLCKTTLDDRLAKKLGVDTIVKDNKDDPNQLERFTAKIVYYLLMMLVVVGVLQYAGLSQAAGPIEGFVTKITAALPLIGKAVLILVFAYFAGVILENLVARIIDGARLDQRFAELSDEPTLTEHGEAVAPKPFSQGASRVVFWLVMVAGLAGAVDALRIRPLAEPMRNAIDQMVSLLPALAIAAAILVAGYAIGRIARAVVHNLLDSAGFNKLIARLKLDSLFGETPASRVVGWVAMAFIVLQAGIAALGELGLETLSVPLTVMMTEFWAYLPILAVSLLIVGAGVLGGRLLRGLVESALANMDFDQRMARLGFGELEQGEGRLSKPHQVVGLIVQVGVILVAVVQALDNLALDTWSGYVNGFIEYSVTHALVALVIVGVGLALGNYVRDLILMRRTDEDDDGARWIATFARYAVLVFAFTMAIHHLDVGPGFVLVAFALLFGSLCLAVALAFGLGGREVAGEVVRRQYNKARTNMNKSSSLATPPGAPTRGTDV